MNRLENAARKGLRVAVMRRGTEYIVTASTRAARWRPA
jgi:hypothetical protein